VAEKASKGRWAASCKRGKHHPDPGEGAASKPSFRGKRGKNGHYPSSLGEKDGAKLAGLMAREEKRISESVGRRGREGSKGNLGDCG